MEVSFLTRVFVHFVSIIETARLLKLPPKLRSFMIHQMQQF